MPDQEDHTLGDGVEIDDEVEMVGIPAENFSVGITTLKPDTMEFGMQLPAGMEHAGEWLYAWCDVERAIQIRDHIDKLINKLTS